MNHPSKVKVIFYVSNLNHSTARCTADGADANNNNNKKGITEASWSHIIDVILAVA